MKVDLPLSSGVPGIVLSNTKPRDMARNMLLDSMTVTTLSRVILPVLIDL